MKRLLFIVTLTLLLILSALAFFYFTKTSEESLECGVFIKDESSAYRFSVSDEDKWKEYWETYLGCEDGFITATVPFARDGDNFRQVKFMITERTDYPRRAKWNDKQLVFDFDNNKENQVLTISFNPQGFLKDDWDLLSEKISVFINEMVVSMAIKDQIKAKEVMSDWYGSKNNLSNMGLEIE